MELVYYSTLKGRTPYAEWFDSLRDPVTKTFILRRLDRMIDGNPGDTKYCRDGVWELRIDKGPGYRIYYAKINNILIVLLCAGDKSTQSKDIEQALSYLSDYKKQNEL